MRRLGLLLLVAIASGCATAYRVVPVQSPPATVRYDNGSPTTDLEQRNGAVQVTPLQFNEDGRLVFAVAAFNYSGQSVNFGIENIEARTSQNKNLRIYSVDDLAREARNKAIAADVALVILGAVAAAASEAAAHQSYRSTYYTPHGVYRYKATFYNPGQAAEGIAASSAATSAGIYAVHRTLNETIARIGESMLQTTTVDPGESVGGRVVVKRAGGAYPPEVAMVIRWNGDQFPFRFQLRRLDDIPAVPEETEMPAEVATPADDSASPDLSAAVPAPKPAETTTATATWAWPAADATNPAPSRPASVPVAQRAAAAHAAPVVAKPAGVAPGAASPATSAPAHATRSAIPDDDYNRQIWEEQQRYSK